LQISEQTKIAIFSSLPFNWPNNPPDRLYHSTQYTMAIAGRIASQLIHHSRQNNSIISPIVVLQQSFSSISHRQTISTTCNHRRRSHQSSHLTYNSPHHCNISITPKRKLSNTNSNMSIQPQVHGIFHKGTSTLTYIITDPSSKETIILDSVLDYDAGSGCTSNTHGEEVVKYCTDNGLIVKYILESHVHGKSCLDMLSVQKCI